MLIMETSLTIDYDKQWLNCVSAICPVFLYKSKYKKVVVLPIWIVKYNVSSVGPSSVREKQKINKKQSECI